MPAGSCTGRCDSGSRSPAGRAEAAGDARPPDIQPDRRLPDGEQRRVAQPAEGEADGQREDEQVRHGAVHGAAILAHHFKRVAAKLLAALRVGQELGQGGFQEVEQMALFKDMVCYQEEVRDASRVAEVLNRVIMNAKRLSAPAQINMPRDFWTQVIDINLPVSGSLQDPQFSVGGIILKLIVNLLRPQKGLPEIDRLPLGAETHEILGIPVHKVSIPVAAGRNLAVLLEAAVRSTILLLRGIPEKNFLVHRGGWSKSAEGSWETRGKTLGIVGYGSIGRQVARIRDTIQKPRHHVADLRDAGLAAQREGLGADQLFAARLDALENDLVHLLKVGDQGGWDRELAHNCFLARSERSRRL